MRVEFSTLLLAYLLVQTADIVIGVLNENFDIFLLLMHNKIRHDWNSSS